MLRSLEGWLLRWTACADQDGYLSAEPRQPASQHTCTHAPSPTLFHRTVPFLSPDQGLATLILLALPVCYSLMALGCLHASAAATGAWDVLFVAQGAGAGWPRVACLAWSLHDRTAFALRRHTEDAASQLHHCQTPPTSVCSLPSAPHLAAAKRHMVGFQVDAQTALVESGEKPTVTPAMLAVSCSALGAAHVMRTSGGARGVGAMAMLGCSLVHALNSEPNTCAGPSCRPGWGT